MFLCICFDREDNMPRRDGTGPFGSGPIGGRRGPCGGGSARGLRRGFGNGSGRGLGRGLGRRRGLGAIAPDKSDPVRDLEKN